MTAANRSFATRLSLNILMITTVLFMGAIVIEGISSHKLLADEATVSTQRLLDATMMTIQSGLTEVETAVKNSAWLVSDNIDNPDFMYHITDKLISENPDIIGAAVAYRADYFKGQHWVSPYSYSDPETGRLMSKSLGNEEYDYFAMDWYTIPANEGHPSWCEPYLDEGGGGYLMTTYSYPVFDKNWEVVAVITADLSLQGITSKLSQIKPYPTATVNLMSSKGVFLNVDSLDPEFEGKDIYDFLEYEGGSKDMTEVVNAVMSGGKGVLPYHQGLKASFIVFDSMRNGWKVSIMCGYKEVLAGASKMHLHLFINALASLLLQFLLGWLIIKRTTAPLVAMSVAARNISKGDFNTPLPELNSKHDDEITQLRNSFIEMQNSLNDRIEDLKESTAANARYASELYVASGIQMAMVPKILPQNENLWVDAFIHPAKEVGGDFYDCHLEGDNLFFLVGDVSGKGVPASLIMAMNLFSFRLLQTIGMDVDQVVQKVNDTVTSSTDSGMFATLFYGRINLQSGEFTFCNAGHNPLVIIEPGEEPKFLEQKTNLAVGVWNGFNYEKQTVQLKKGTKLVAYTDGVTEAEKADKSQYGESRLLDWARRVTGKDASSKFDCNSLLADVHNFTQGNEQNDDITIMTIKL